MSNLYACPACPDAQPPLVDKICEVLNCASRENVSDTPDFVLAEFMLRCLEAFESAVNLRQTLANGRMREGSALDGRWNTIIDNCYNELDKAGIPDGLPLDVRVKMLVDWHGALCQRGSEQA